MLDHDRRVIHSSEESNWRTPPACFAALDHHFGFQLDAAADAVSALCPRWLGPGSPLGENSLAADWYKVADPASPLVHRIFLNPPYSKKRKQPIEPWVQKCWEQSQRSCTIVAILPFSPQTQWYRNYVYGCDESGWSGHAAMEEWRLPHRISFLRPDGSPAGNAGVNSVIIVWRPNPGFIGPWQPAVRYWSYR